MNGKVSRIAIVGISSRNIWRSIAGRGRLAALSAASLLATNAVAAGPVSPLYVNGGADGTIYVVQGNQVLNSWQAQVSGLSAIAVLDTVHIALGASGFPVEQYTLSGGYLGSSTFPNMPQTSIYDGASDGTYIYGWDYIQNRAIRFDSNWQNPVPLFSISANSGDYLGITYDSGNNSLWVSGWNTSDIRNYSMTGQLLSSFSVSHDQNGALALDPATGTLWLANNNVIGQMEEYSKTGTLLDTETYAAFGTRFTILGAEFQVPEPTTTGLLVLGLLTVGYFRRAK